MVEIEKLPGEPRARHEIRSMIGIHSYLTASQREWIGFRSVRNNRRRGVPRSALATRSIQGARCRSGAPAAKASFSSWPLEHRIRPPGARLHVVELSHCPHMICRYVHISVLRDILTAWCSFDCGEAIEGHISEIAHCTYWTPELRWQLFRSVLSGCRGPRGRLSDR